MTFLWLLVWLCSSTPPVTFSGTWNAWAISLVVCFAIDVVGSRSTL